MEILSELVTEVVFLSMIFRLLYFVFATSGGKVLALTDHRYKICSTLALSEDNTTSVTLKILERDSSLSRPEPSESNRLHRVGEEDKTISVDLTVLEKE